MSTPHVTRRRLHELLRFVILTVVSILALAVLWPFLAPRYSPLAAAGANGLFAARDAPIRVWVDEDGNLRADRLRTRRGGVGTERVTTAVGLRGTWEGMLLLLALVAATPRIGWKRRLALLGLALGLVSCYYTFFVMAYFNALLSPQAKPMHYFWVPFAEVAVPVLLWAMLTLRDWFPRPETPADSTPSGHDSAS